MNLAINKLSRFRPQLQLLKRIEPTDVNFLTCYLDTSSGNLEALSIFRQLKNRFRRKLDARQQFDFDHAARMVEDSLANLDVRFRSVSIFCRSILGGQFFLVMPVPFKLENRFFFQAKPAIGKLLKAFEKTRIISAGQVVLERLQTGQNARVRPGKSSISRDISIDIDCYSLAQGLDDATDALPRVVRNAQLRHSNAHLDLVT